MQKAHTLNDDGDRVQVSPTIHAETVHNRMLRLVWGKNKTAPWYKRIFGIKYEDDTQTIVLTKADIAKIAAIEW